MISDPGATDVACDGVRILTIPITNRAGRACRVGNATPTFTCSCYNESVGIITTRLALSDPPMIRKTEGGTP